MTAQRKPPKLTKREIETIRALRGEAPFHQGEGLLADMAGYMLREGARTRREKSLLRKLRAMPEARLRELSRELRASSSLA